MVFIDHLFGRSFSLIAEDDRNAISNLEVQPGSGFGLYRLVADGVQEGSTDNTGVQRRATCHIRR
jgi:hypothetical protein